MEKLERKERRKDSEGQPPPIPEKVKKTWGSLQLPNTQEVQTALCDVTKGD